MIAGVAAYKGTPSKVYLRKNGIKQVQYVTYAKYLKIKAVWDTFVNTNQREPNYVYINDPVPTPDSDWILVNNVIYHHQETAYTCGPVQVWKHYQHLEYQVNQNLKWQH